MSSISIAGDTSGSIALAAPAIAGTNTITLPANTGTVALTSDLGGMTLLGTITTTAVNSVSLSGLTLTSYKSLFIGFTGFSINGANSQIFISSSNAQSGGGMAGFGANTAFSGTASIDLNTNAIGGGHAPNTIITSAAISTAPVVGGKTDISTSTTTIYFRVSSINAFAAGASIVIYGVK